MHLTSVALSLLLAGCSTSSDRSATPSVTPTFTVQPSASPTMVHTPSPSPSGGSSPTPSRTATRSPSPSSTRPPTSSPHAAAAVAIWRGQTSRRLVALTFDAGSDVGHTQQVLDLLKAKGVRASFGLTGVWVRANPSLARRIVTDGHQVVNHTDRHLSFTGRSTGTAPLTRAQRTEALAAAESSIRSITGTSALPWFRPPYGDRDAGVDRDVGAAGYRYELMWTVDTLGWKGVPPAEVTSRVLNAATPGEIVLMHVGTASTDWQALADVIDGLRAKGYGFVRADAF